MCIILMLNSGKITGTLQVDKLSVRGNFLIFIYKIYFFLVLIVTLLTLFDFQMTAIQIDIRKEEINMKITESGVEFDKYAEEMLNCLESPARVTWDALTSKPLLMYINNLSILFKYLAKL